MTSARGPALPLWLCRPGVHDLPMLQDRCHPRMFGWSVGAPSLCRWRQTRRETQGQPLRAPTSLHTCGVHLCVFRFGATLRHQVVPINDKVSETLHTGVVGRVCQLPEVKPWQLLWLSTSTYKPLEQVGRGCAIVPRRHAPAPPLSQHSQGVRIIPSQKPEGRE